MRRRRRRISVRTPGETRAFCIKIPGRCRGWEIRDLFGVFGPFFQPSQKYRVHRSWTWREAEEPFCWKDRKVVFPETLCRCSRGLFRSKSRGRTGSVRLGSLAVIEGRGSKQELRSPLSINEIFDALSLGSSFFGVGYSCRQRYH